MTDASDYRMSNSSPEPPRQESSKPKRTLESELPSDVMAERYLLGAILLDNQKMIEIEESLEADDFSLDSHQRIYKRMSALAATGQGIDLVTLSSELGRFKEVDAVGGVSYLSSLSEGLPRRPVVGDYVRILRDKSLARELMTICSGAIARAAEQAEPSVTVGLDLSSQIQDAITSGLSNTLERAGEFLNKTFPTARAMTQKTAKSKGLETGFEEFDEMTCGLQKGELAIIGARPSMGKTAWACKVAEHATLNCDAKVAIFSLEMSKESLLSRMICSRARVPFQDYKKGTMTEAMLEEYESVYEEICNSNLYIDDEPKTAKRIAAQSRALKAKSGLDLVLIDYLGLMQHEETKRQVNTTQLVGMDALILKLLAKELGIPVALLAQLHRDLTKRTDKRPVLSDLRDSGNLEEHADLVAFLHREGYYDPKDESLKNKGETIIAKQRQGPIGTCHVAWDGNIMRWSDKIDPKDFSASAGAWWMR